MKKQYIILFIILLITGLFRFYYISSYPAGLFPDEAANGLDAEHVLEGRHSVFFEKGNGREGLYFYFLAGIFKIFGSGVWQVHLCSAIIGFLAVIAFYFLISQWFNWKIASLSSFFMAISLPAVVMSRVGFRAVLITLTMPLFLLFITKALKKKNIIYQILAGFFLSLNLYTYISARIIIIAFTLFIIIIFAKQWKKLIIISLSAFLTFLPLGIYFFLYPEWLFERAGHVSIFNPDLNNGSAINILLLNIKKAVLMFFWPGAGDLNWRHNISGMPFFSPIIAFLAILGLGYLIYKLIQKAQARENYFLHCIILIWFFAGLAPMILTAEAIPHFLRVQGIIPVVFIFPALGIAWAYRLARNKPLKIMFWTWFSGIMIISLILNFILYFSIAKSNLENHYAFRADLTKTAELINSRNNKEKTFLVLDDYSVQTIDFLTYRHGQKFILVKPELINEQEYPQDSLVIFTESTEYDYYRFNKNVENKLINYEWK